MTRKTTNQPVNYPPIQELTLSHVPTAQAAYYLNRKSQTLRNWACFQPAGMPRPVTIQRRLAWPVDQIVSLLLTGGAK